MNVSVILQLVLVYLPVAILVAYLLIVIMKSCWKCLNLTQLICVKKIMKVVQRECDSDEEFVHSRLLDEDAVQFESE